MRAFLAGDLLLDGGQQCDGSGEKARLEAGSEFGMGGGRIKDEPAFARENGQGGSETMFFERSCFYVCCIFMCFDGLTD
jgi:hypothetical protein